MDLNKLGQMLGFACGGFLVEDTIFNGVGFQWRSHPCLISYRGVWVNLICVLGTSYNYQFEIMSLKSSLAIMMV